MEADQTGSDGEWGALSALPGNPMMWILVISELAVFGALLLGFATARLLDPETFQSSRAHLHPLLAGINTAVLVTSGYLVAVGVRLRQQARSARPLILAAMVLGSVFLGIKAIEYTSLIEAGLGIETNTFFRLYYLITGFHALHIVFGIVILAIVCVADSLENVESGAAFWHMLDLVWVFIYPILYLVG